MLVMSLASRSIAGLRVPIGIGTVPGISYVVGNYQDINHTNKYNTANDAVTRGTAMSDTFGLVTGLSAPSAGGLQ